MNCPFCNNQVQHLALHIKEEHPKKFKFLRNNKPELYKRLQKELEIHEMVKSKDPNLFILDVDNAKQYFRYHCVRCENCCHEYEIEIQKEDMEKWATEKREELLEALQIYPKSISVMNLGLVQRLAEIEVSDISLDQISFISSIFDREKIDSNKLIEEIISHEKTKISQETRNKIKSILDIQNQIIGYYLTGDVKELSEKIIININNLKDFILINHNYLGEPVVDKWGNIIKDPALEELKIQMPEYFDENFGAFKGKIPHWFLGIKYGPKAILSPKSFQVIRKGWELGLSYYLIYEIKGGCGFLKNNLCSIHEYKPLACKLFPYNRSILSQEADKIFLQTCKGLKRIL